MTKGRGEVDPPLRSSNAAIDVFRTVFNTHMFKRDTSWFILGRPVHGAMGAGTDWTFGPLDRESRAWSMVNKNQVDESLLWKSPREWCLG